MNARQLGKTEAMQAFFKMTKELPTKEGYYWWMAKGDYSNTVKSIVKVLSNREGECYIDWSGSRRLVKDWEDDSVQYWQYIPEPKDP